MRSSLWTDRVVHGAIVLLVAVGLVAAIAWDGFGFTPANLQGAYGRAVDAHAALLTRTLACGFWLGTGALLTLLWRFRSLPGRSASGVGRAPGAGPAWITLAGGGLAVLAWLEITAWNAHGAIPPSAADELEIQVLAEQFAWNFRYAGTDRTFGTQDDAGSAGVMWVPLHRRVRTRMLAKDVIHSFFVPGARVKQDVIPGRFTRTGFTLDRIPCWDLRTQQLVLLSETEFDVARVATNGYVFRSSVRQIRLGKGSGDDPTGVHAYAYELSPAVAAVEIWQHGRREDLPPAAARADYVLHWIEIACAELCGFGHGGMRGLVRVLPEALFARELAARAGAVDEKWRIFDQVRALTGGGDSGD